ncbi:MAG: METTL5 family protein [Thermoplasmata archaeon]
MEIELSKLKRMAIRDSRLEQYPTPPDIAATMLYRALGDGCLRDKIVADLGCGNGIFAIGALMLGARKAYGIDSDEDAIIVARENSEQFGDRIILTTEDVAEFNVPVDTILMNPPFGSQKRNADIPFIEKALEYSKDFYIVLNYKAGDFLENVIEGKGEILWEEDMEIPVAHSYEFHRKEIKMIKAKMSRVRVW